MFVRGRLRHLLVLGAVLFAVLVSVGGATTYVALGITTKPEFCATCHIMEPYVESWRTSSHNHVPCVDCHYEPGLLETFEGKFKALSQLAKYVTATQGTKPWAEVSDYSCMRSGCHSNRLLEGELQFGRVRFDHRHHLVGLRRGKRLRCTSCHSQIVQGNHLTVTPTTCILCHFKKSPESKPLDDCFKCHGPPPDEIQLGSFTFRHSDYLARGVACKSCHGDVTRGTGDVPRARCGSCHNQQAHLQRYDDVEFIHNMHVTEHSVDCLECHTEVEHGLTKKEEHFQGACSDCHTGPHESTSGIYRGTGGRGVEDNPSVMYMARVTCTGCHRPPFAGAPEPEGGATWKADPLACLACHGPAYDGMLAAWQKETRGNLATVKAMVDALGTALAKDGEKRDAAAARKAFDDASHNLGMVLLDGSGGAHNLPYVRSLLQRAAEDAHTGLEALAPGTAPKVPRIGPTVVSQQNCTMLCHAGIQDRGPVVAFDRYTFLHTPHLTTAGMDCSDCHEAEPHGTTTVRPADCAECHHPDAEEAEQCMKCHADVAALKKTVPEKLDPDPMADIDCTTCHDGIQDGHDPKKVLAMCAECHEDEVEEDGVEAFQAAWRKAAGAPLDEVEAKLKDADPSIGVRIRREIERLRRTGPFHNAPAVKEEAEKMLERLR